MVSVDPNHAFPSQNPLQLGLRLGYLPVVSTVFCVRSLCCVARQENQNSSIITLFSSNDSKELFWDSIQLNIATCSLFIAKFTPKLASELTLVLLKFDHFIRFGLRQDFLDLTPQISVKCLLMRLTGVWMVSNDPDHAFPCQNLPKLGIRICHWTVVGRVPHATN